MDRPDRVTALALLGVPGNVLTTQPPPTLRLASVRGLNRLTVLATIPRKTEDALKGLGFGQEISSFRLHLAAEGKAAKTVRTCTEAVQWFAAHLLAEVGPTNWEDSGKQDVHWWMVWLLEQYSVEYISNRGNPARSLSASRSALPGERCPYLTGDL